MSYNGSGTFTINSTGQPVVAGTVITASAFNSLTTDLATGLTTAITKDGQTTTTARITFAQGITSSLVTDSSSVSTGSIITAGGAGIAKNLYVGVNANVAGTLGVTGVATFSAAPIYSSLTASSAVATDASKGLVSVTNTGTGNNVLATSPTITTPTISSLSSAAATALTLQSAGTTAITVDTAQNVGIGVTTVNARLVTYPTTNYSTTWNNLAGSGLHIISGGTGGTGNYGGAVTFSRIDGGNPDRQEAAISAVQTTSDLDQVGLAFFTHGSDTTSDPLTERMRIDSSGRVLVGLTSANTSGANFQVSSGISFPATQSASSDANTLDDYEEGTFTPTWVGSTSNPTQSGNSICSYVKVGRLVTVFGDFYCTSLSGGSGELRLGGLPFTIANTNDAISGISFGLTNLFTATAAPRVAYTQPNTNYIRLHTANSSDARNNYITSLTIASSGLTAFSEIYFNFSYLASA